MTETLITRQEANDLIDLLMDTSGPKQMRKKPGRSGPVARHFGRCELAELLDAIYGREDARRVVKLVPRNARRPAVAESPAEDRHPLESDVPAGA